MIDRNALRNSVTDIVASADSQLAMLRLALKTSRDSKEHRSNWVRSSVIARVPRERWDISI
jgi:hypothetical protein